MAIYSIILVFSGNLDPDALLEMIDTAVRIGDELHDQLDKHLSSESRAATL